MYDDDKHPQMLIRMYYVVISTREKHNVLKISIELVSDAQDSSFWFSVSFQTVLKERSWRGPGAISKMP